MKSMCSRLHYLYRTSPSNLTNATRVQRQTKHSAGIRATWNLHFCHRKDILKTALSTLTKMIQNQGALTGLKVMSAMEIGCF